MAPPRRTAPRRTAAGIAEDLVQARRVGGLLRSGEDELTATLEFIALTRMAPNDEAMARARDLLLSYVRQGCRRSREEHPTDRTAQAAAMALETLLTREVANTRKVQSIRQDAVAAVGGHVTADAVRHREERLIQAIAAEVFADFQARTSDEPASVEEAVHRLARIASDVRQQLHDGLCLTYLHVPAADPHEQRVIAGYYEQQVIRLGELLLAAVQLMGVGLKSALGSPQDLWFVRQAQSIKNRLFTEKDDRDWVLDLMRRYQGAAWDYDALVSHFISTARGRETYDRWVAWANSCFPTCAFERTTMTLYMCSPHQLITQLYEVELAYIDSGYSELNIVANEPILHHGLGHGSKGHVT